MLTRRTWLFASPFIGILTILVLALSTRSAQAEPPPPFDFSGGDVFAVSMSNGNVLKTFYLYTSAGSPIVLSPTGQTQGLPLTTALHPVLTPDGSKVVFGCGYNGVLFHICSMNANGVSNAATDITENASENYTFLDISPDGNWALASVMAGNAAVLKAVSLNISQDPITVLASSNLPTTLTSGFASGADWGEDNYIYVAISWGGGQIYRTRDPFNGTPYDPNVQAVKVFDTTTDFGDIFVNYPLSSGYKFIL